MKVYHLIIAYDEDSEEVEYIEESIELTADDGLAYIELDMEDIERTSTIEVIQQLKTIAEA